MSINRWAGYARAFTCNTWGLKRAVPLVSCSLDTCQIKKKKRYALNDSHTDQFLCSTDLWITPWSSWFYGITARKFGKTSSEFFTGSSGSVGSSRHTLEDKYDKKGGEMWAANKSLIVTCDIIHFIALLTAYKYGQQNALQVKLLWYAKLSVWVSKL